MSVRLRLMRVGKRNRPAYRICAIDQRRQRDGAYLENLGFYDPYVSDRQKQLRLNKERAEYWLSIGASPSFTVLSFLRREKVDGLLRTKAKSKRRRRKLDEKLAARRTKRRAKRDRKNRPKEQPQAKKAAEPAAAESTNGAEGEAES